MNSAPEKSIWNSVFDVIESLVESDVLYQARPDLKEYKNRLDQIERTKTICDVKYLLCNNPLFTLEELRYVGSELLYNLYTALLYDDPLKEASKRGQIDVLRFLIARGGRVHDWHAVSAIQSGHKETYEYITTILNKGFGYSCDKREYYYLDTVVSSITTVELMVRYLPPVKCNCRLHYRSEVRPFGCIVHICPVIFYTQILCNACAKGAVVIVAYLLEHVLELDKYENVFLPMVEACKRGFTPIVKLLLNYVHPTTRAFLLACENGHYEVAKVLLESSDAFISDVVQSSESYLIDSEVYFPIVLMKTENELKKSLMQRAMLLAYTKGQKKVVELLLKHGAVLDY